MGKAPLRGIKVYLADRYFKGIGEVLAETIVDDGDMDSLRVIRGESFKIKDRFKLKDEHAQSIQEGWQKTKDTAYYDILLNELGFSSFQKKRIKDDFGLSVLQTLIINPLSLIGSVPFLSFVDIENICERLRLNITDEQKALAATEFELKKVETRDGHTCAPFERIIPNVAKLTELDSEFIVETVKNNESGFSFSKRNNKEIIQTEKSLKRDKKIIQEIDRITNSFARGKNKKNFLKSELKTQKDVDLSDEQMLAVNAAINNPISIITGGPGAGKTTMVRALVSAIVNLNLKLKLTAPTGKAATRISTEGLKQYKPSTIHSYLGVFGETTDKEYDIMIVDESSMIDINLMQDLLVSIPDKASIVFIGDADQLPPVGPGQVFKDLIESDKITVVKLTGNYRQHLMSGIAKAAREIVKGKTPVLEKDYSKEMIFDEISRGNQAEKILLSYFDTLPKLGISMDEIQILSPQRDGETGVYNLNRLIQQRLTSSSNPVFTKQIKNKNNDFEMNFFVGDKVIMRKNKVKELGLVNGDIGKILRKSGNTIVTEFNEKEVEFSTKNAFDLELAYAITIHLSQGSDYKGIIMACSSEHQYMLRKNLIYTALTRAKVKAVIVGEKKSLIEGIQKGWMDFRYTNLVNLIREE